MGTPSKSYSTPAELIGAVGQIMSGNEISGDAWAKVLKSTGIPIVGGYSDFDTISKRITTTWNVEVEPFKFLNGYEIDD